MSTAPVVSKVWRFCTALRDGGAGYHGYPVQRARLSFPKLADGYARPPYGRDMGITAGDR